MNYFSLNKWLVRILSTMLLIFIRKYTELLYKDTYPLIMWFLLTTCLWIVIWNTKLRLNLHELPNDPLLLISLLLWYMLFLQDLPLLTLSRLPCWLRSVNVLEIKPVKPSNYWWVHLILVLYIYIYFFYGYTPIKDQ